ncbi:MAG: response regulator transcription factor [Chloroflexi bacterium]|nr:response regulator transcription factor [Chloroflexota bacterium]
MIRLLILAPTPVARAGWRALLAATAPGAIAIAAETGSMAELTAQIGQARPDVVLLDPAPDDESFVDMLRAVTRTYPGLRAIVLGEPRAVTATEALGAGARGYLRLAVSGAEVAAAIAAVNEGLIVLDPVASGPLLDRVTGTPTAPLPPPAPLPSLTRRELEVLQLLASGLTNRGIARQLRMSEHTAKFHVGSVLGKLGAASRAEAVAVAARAGLLLH